MSISTSLRSGKRESSSGRLGRIFERVALYAQQAPQHAQLFLGTEALVIQGHQRDGMRTVAHDPARGKLGNGGGLADTRRADEGDAAARVEQ